MVVSIYLIHIFAIHGRQRVFDHLVRHLPSPWADTLDAVIFYATTIAAAALCFSFVEVPARRFLVRRIARSVHGRAAFAAARSAVERPGALPLDPIKGSPLKS